jgi:hypothetical protein
MGDLPVALAGVHCYALSGGAAAAGAAISSAVTTSPMSLSPISQTTADPVASSRRAWTLLSNHGHVLVCLARNPEMRMRDIAQSVGITERACYRIVGDLEQAGLLRRERVGRNNRYTIDRAASARHPLWRGMRASQLLALD